MRIRDEDVEKLLNSLKIEEVVGEVVSLKRSGANYKGLCPFHSDTSPSFTVSPQKNIAKCFSCGAGGNTISFYSQYHKISFNEACLELAKKYNIDIQFEKSFDEAKEKEYEKLYGLMEEARDFFAEMIFNNEGRDAFEYLNKRGLSVQFIKENNIGYSPNSWDKLLNHFIDKGYSVEDLLNVGLIKKGDKGYYDTFRDRIMFPISNIGAKTIAFGGRTMEDRKDIAKYLNSSDTILFNKGHNLYGIKERGSLIRKKNYSILMEGYMDVLKAHSFGFDTAIASLGTAFTTDQGELLKRYSSNVIIAYDMDDAGRKATERTGLILKEQGFNIRVIEFDDAKDPDEYLNSFGKEKFLERVKESKEIFDFLYEFYAKEYNLNDLLGKQNFVLAFKPFFSILEKDIEKALYLEKLAKNLEIDKSFLEKELISNNKKESSKFFKKVENKNYFIEKKDTKSIINSLESQSLKLSLVYSNFVDFFWDKKIESPIVRKIINLVKEEINTDKVNYSKKLIQNNSLNEEEKGLVLVYLTSYMSLSESNKEKLSYELIKSWFRIEINEEMKKYKESMKLNQYFQLKQILKKLEDDKENNEFVNNLYKDFKNLV
ncbi:MAG: DNA primase [Fusobacteriaceae bacterium]|nr:DNA primase [Fusobacteriaceae bacterium]MBP6467524.1 DNA primase [Fusobacteriaceae bacterium]